ncbi:DsbA family protein [Erythrobacter donghaensis]|uniref:DsbA family protein n=1 Tax=Erythrobacter donghaensis TaxID=267135 RepID=UPI000A36EE35|nr:thioredoxin domain-containing protein [Erythrobacter donghaensis]
MIKPLILSAAAGAAALAVASVPVTAQKQQQGLERPDSAFVPQDNPGNWQAIITRTERGHVIGNPKADAQMIEFISYTCPHCADFTARGEPAIEIVLLKPGKLTVEVRPVIRNEIDTTVTLLAQCGDPAGFKARHQALMLSQADWLGKARAAPQSQQALWMRGDRAGRMNAASALGLTQMLVARGQSQSELDACVSDDAAAQRLRDNSKADFAEIGVNSTPSFALDGKLMADVHSWEALYPALSARFSARPDS